MKRIVLFICCIVAILQVQAQIFQMPATGEYTDQYILSEAFKKCGDLELLNSNGTTLSLFPNNTYSGKCKVRDYAQLYHSDTMITIVGIAAYNYAIRLDYEIGGYFALADTNFDCERIINMNDFYAFEYDDNGEKIVKIMYNEMFFEEPIDIIGDYYLLMNSPKLYPYGDNPYFSQNSVIKIACVTECDIKDIIKVRDFYYYKSDGGYYYSDTLTDWYPLSKSTDKYTDSRISSLVMFPIMKASDTSALSSVAVDNYTYIFPNPASDNVTVQCSFRMKTIEVYNSLGQKVEEFIVDGYNKSINTEKYPKGNYILKIITESGTTDKKLVVQ